MERIKLFLCKTFTWIKLGIQVVEGFLNLKTLFWLERRVWNFKLLFRLFSTSTGWQAHFKLGTKTTKQWEWWDFVSILSWASKNQKALNVLHFCASIYQKFCEVYLSSKNFCRSFSLKLLFFCKSLSWCCIYWMLLSPKFTFAKVLHCRSIKFERSPVVL